MKGQEIIASQIRSDLQERRKLVKDLLIEMRMSYATWTRRLQDPYSFTAYELAILLKYISLDTFRLIVPNKKLKGE